MSGKASVKRTGWHGRRRQAASSLEESNGCLLALEPRLMFDGAAPFTAAEALETPEALPPESESQPQGEDGRSPAELIGACPAAPPAARELIFVDGAVADQEKLLRSVAPETRIVILNPDLDGLTQMEEALQGERDLESIHIISHGDSGGLQLGATVLDGQTLSEQGLRIKGWGEALAEDGDILLYGCEVAAGPEGRNFLAQLSDLTGAEVAASTDPTGHAALGGDWDLEARTGAIEAGIPFAAGVSQWRQTLDAADLVTVDSSGNQADGATWEAAQISEDGRYVVFSSSATNLVPGDTNGFDDVFVHDRLTGQTERVSVGSGGGQANGSSWDPSVSADGRFVVFNSDATNLVVGDTNGQSDIFVHDRSTGQTTRVSVNSGGTEADGYSYKPVITDDGRYVVFESSATNLVATDTNAMSDIFIHDRSTGQTELISVSSLGIQADNGSYHPAVTPDGRYVAFHSYATNLVTGDTNGLDDIFVHDRSSGQTERVSMDSLGNEPSGGSSLSPSLSADGRLVVFESSATNLVAGDTNGATDIFLHDRATGETKRLSVAPDSTEADNSSYNPMISRDGRTVVFTSWASNLMPNDFNGAGDIFLHDVTTGKIEPATTLDQTTTASGAVFSGDGRYLLLTTSAALVPEDTNSLQDVYVIDRNDAPLLDSGSVPVFPAINEDESGGAGQTVAELLAQVRLFDPDHEGGTGLAVTGVDNSNGTWQYSLDGGAVWHNFGPVSDLAATLLSGSESVVCRPDNSLDLAAGDLALNGVAVGPVTLTGAPVNGLNMSGAYNLLLAINGLQGLTGVEAAGATLHGAGLLPVAAGSTDVSFLLNGYAISFHTVGSTVSDIGQATVDAINSATPQTGVRAFIGNGANGGQPDEIVLINQAGDTSEIVIDSYAETNGFSSTGLGNGVFAFGPGANTGMVGLASPGGSFTLSTGSGNDAVLQLLGLGGGEFYTRMVGDLADDGQLTVTSPANRIRFVPGADFHGTATISFRAWDQTAGFDGETGVDVSANGGSAAFSTLMESGSIMVQPVNDAPVLDGAGTGDFSENGPPVAVAPLLTIGDLDNSTLSRATVRISANYAEGQDELLFTDTAGLTSTWDPAAATLTLTGTGSVADYEAALRSVQFVNRSEDPPAGPRTISIAVSDGQAAGMVQASMSVTPVNDAPVLSAAAPALTGITAGDPASGGDLVASLLNGIGSDAEGAVLGLAVVGADVTRGDWQYSLDTGASWQSFGPLAENAATLLDPNALVRFVPEAGFAGTAGLTFRAWDQTAGHSGQTAVDVSMNGGATPFSAVRSTATITVQEAIRVSPPTTVTLATTSFSSFESYSTDTATPAATSLDSGSFESLTGEPLTGETAFFETAEAISEFLSAGEAAGVDGTVESAELGSAPLESEAELSAEEMASEEEIGETEEVEEEQEESDEESAAEESEAAAEAAAAGTVAGQALNSQGVPTGPPGLSAQLAREKELPAAERAEVLEIFKEVYELLQCK